MVSLRSRRTPAGGGRVCAATDTTTASSPPLADHPTFTVIEAVWARLEPLIPRRFRYPGRRRADDRAALEGTLYAVRTGIGWNRLPAALFGASGSTCWRRLTEWHEAGVWQQLHELLLAELRAAGLLDLSAALVDSTHLRALKGGTTPGRACGVPKHGSAA
jgi:transposase